VQILTKVQKSVYGMRKMPSSGNLLYDTLYLGQDLVTIVPCDIAWKFNLEDVLRKQREDSLWHYNPQINVAPLLEDDTK